MATVRETCLCGATFDLSTPNGAEVTIAAAHFRRDHLTCRITGAVDRSFDSERRGGSPVATPKDSGGGR